MAGTTDKEIRKLTGLGRKSYVVGLSECIDTSSAAGGISTFYGAGAAFNGMNAPIYKALYGREGDDIQVEFELWKEQQEWERDHGE